MKKFAASAVLLALISCTVLAQTAPLSEASPSQPLFRWSASAAGLLSVSGFSEGQAYTDAYGRDHQGRLGESGEYDMPWMYVGGFYEQERRIFNLGATISNADETLGAWLSIETSIPHYSGVDFSGLGFVWWQPLDQFKMSLGYSSPTEGDPLHLFLVDAGFIPIRAYGSAVNSVSGGYHSWWNPQRVHHGYGRESVMAATFEFFNLVPNLYITTSTPFEPSWNGARGGASSIYESSALDILVQTAAQVAYTFPKAGILALTWDGGTMQVDQHPLADSRWLPGGGGGLFFDDPAFLTAGFTFTRLYEESRSDNALFYIGFDAPLPSTRWRSGYIVTRPADPSIPELPEVKEWRKGSENYDEITVQRPLGVDLRAYIKSGDFTFAGGVAANFLGYTAYKPEGEAGLRIDMPFTAGATLNPQYNLGFINAGLVGEFKYHAKQDNVADQYVMFNAAGYIKKDIAQGTLWIAVHVEGLALDDSDPLNPDGLTPWKQGIRWSVPVGLKITI